MPLSDRDYMRRPPPRRHYARFNLDPVWVIMGVNLLVFIVARVFPPIVYLLELPSVGFWDQPWTILTSMFTHFEFWHIFANMLTFYFFGTYLISLVGDRRFLIVYFGGGILGNILLLLLAPLFPFYAAIGASGAIYALGGALAVLRPKQKVFVFPIPAPIPLWIAVVGGFFIVALLPSVAWQAHLGGLILGLTAGYFFRRRGR